LAQCGITLLGYARVRLRSQGLATGGDESVLITKQAPPVSERVVRCEAQG
jgi:hypothetical protein